MKEFIYLQCLQNVCFLMLVIFPVFSNYTNDFSPYERIRKTKQATEK